MSPQTFDATLPGDDKYLDKEFEYGKSLCSNNAQKGVVKASRAEFHLSQGRVELAAKYMAQCPHALMPFADTTLRLSLPSLGTTDSNTDDKHGSGSRKAREALASGNFGLITYLSEKMRAAKSRNDGVACTMIGSWLVELYLHEQGRGDSSNGRGRESASSHHRRSASVIGSMMQKFLTSNVYNMDAKTILNILSSHDVTASECVEYAAASGDIGVAVNAALCTTDITVRRR